MSGLYKNIIFLIIASVWFTCSSDKLSAQPRMSKEMKRLEDMKKKDFENFKLSKPKSVEYFLNGEKKGFSMFDIKGNCIENGLYIKGSKITKQKFEYDSFNNITSQTNLKEDGSTGFTKKNEYNTEGKLVSSENNYYDGKPGDKESYRYDERGNLIEIDYNLSTGKFKYYFDYDANTNKIGEKSYLEDSLYYTGIMIYNDKNYLIEEIKNYISAESVDTIRYSYKYDNKGNLLEFSKVSPDTNETYIEKYKYDVKDNNIEYASYNSRGNLEYRYVYIYDERNNLKELSVYDGNDALDRNESYKYDKDYHIIENITSNNDNSVTGKISKKYDKKGNVVEETELAGGKTDKWKYVYEYYE